jgi:hypothetical protein
MTLANAKLMVIEDGVLQDYPIGRDERLDGNSFVKWQTHRWLSSRVFKLATWEVQGMARALFDMCQTESPVGTLPDNDDELAYMLRCDVRRLRDLRAMTLGPLHNWTRCQCGDEIRLMHPVVLEQVQDAIERRTLAALSKEEKAVGMRMARLRKGLLAEGCAKDVVGDDVLIKRIDDWLLATHKGRRDGAVHRSAILHAVQSGWIGRAQAFG